MCFDVEGAQFNGNTRWLSTTKFPTPILTKYNITIDFLWNSRHNHCFNGANENYTLSTLFDQKVEKFGYPYKPDWIIFAFSNLHYAGVRPNATTYIKYNDTDTQHWYLQYRRFVSKFRSWTPR